MTNPSGGKDADEWWQLALIWIEPSQCRIYDGGIRHASGN